MGHDSRVIMNAGCGFVLWFPSAHPLYRKNHDKGGTAAEFQLVNDASRDLSAVDSPTNGGES